ncbi:MAG: c-type cytochrome, partial [Nitrospirota bacterium]
KGRIGEVTVNGGFSDEGKRLFSTLGCLGCHMINDTGNGFAPDLSDIGNKVRPGWLLMFLKNPRTHDPKTIIPDFRIAENDVEKIAAYLMSLKKATVYMENAPPAPDAAAIAKGEKLVKTLGCTGCHEIDKLPAVYNAPDLDAVGDKRVDELAFGNIDNIKRTLKDWMMVKVTDPGRFTTARIASIMPYYNFDEDQSAALVTYLLSLRKDTIPSGYKIPPSNADSKRYEAGAVMEKYNCRGCHKIGVSGGTIGPDLSREGKKSRPEWLFTFLKGPFKIRPIPMLKAGMPDFNLSDSEVDTIVEYLSLMSDEPYPFTFEQRKAIGTDDVWNGEKLYREIFACSGCHTVNGYGGQVGPDHTDLASRLKREWVSRWVENPQAIKPDVSMPRFKLKDWEMNALMDYLMTLGSNRFVDIKSPD